MRRTQLYIPYQRKSERSPAEISVQHAICYLASWFFWETLSADTSERRLIRFGDGDVQAINILADRRREIYEEAERAKQ